VLLRTVSSVLGTASPGSTKSLRASFRSCALSLLVVLALGSCEVGLQDDLSAVGVRKIQGDELELLYVLCEGEKIRTVEVTRFGPSDDSNGRVIWSIQSQPGVPRSSFTVGSAPRDFVESRRLRTALEEGVTYTARIETNLNSFAVISFRLDEVRERVVLAHTDAGRGYSPQTDYENAAGGRCTNI
jgi:hypothetical protein